MGETRRQKIPEERTGGIRKSDMTLPLPKEVLKGMQIPQMINSKMGKEDVEVFVKDICKTLSEYMMARYNLGTPAFDTRFFLFARSLVRWIELDDYLSSCDPGDLKAPLVKRATDLEKSIIGFLNDFGVNPKHAFSRETASNAGGSEAPATSLWTARVAALQAKSAH